MDATERLHPTVLVSEVVTALRPQPGGVYLDATAGTAGHMLALLGECPQARVLGIDRDPAMAALARRRLDAAGFSEDKAPVLIGDYRDLERLLDERGIRELDGCVFDLGANALHFQASGRGFSFRADTEPLDMRFNPDEPVATAADLVAGLDARDLAGIVGGLGDERWAGRIARLIVETRDKEPILTAGQLARLVERAIPRRAWPPEIHPATRTFQALRIRVNGEFDRITEGLPRAIRLLRTGGRIAAISFHSGEDREVKRLFRQEASGGPGDFITGRKPPPRLEILTKKPIGATDEEIRRNPGARSAKLRVAEML